METFYADNQIKLIHADCIQVLKHCPAKTVDLFVIDAPYFLSNDGFTNSGGKKISVNKGSWDKLSSNYNSPYQFYLVLVKECFRVLKSSGTLWFFGTHHNIFDAERALSDVGFRIINSVTWQKSNPAPNLSHRMLTHSTETILWVKKSKHSPYVFNYEEMKSMAGGRQMTDVWTTPVIQNKERLFGKHPTQKPLSVIERIILCATNKGMVVMDPFIGSGTTAVACTRLGRFCWGIERSKKYLEVARRRILDEQT